MDNIFPNRVRAINIVTNTFSMLAASEMSMVLERLQRVSINFKVEIRIICGRSREVGCECLWRLRNAHNVLRA